MCPPLPRFGILLILNDLKKFTLILQVGRYAFYAATKHACFQKCDVCTYYTSLSDVENNVGDVNDSYEMIYGKKLLLILAKIREVPKCFLRQP